MLTPSHKRRLTTIEAGYGIKGTEHDDVQGRIIDIFWAMLGLPEVGEYRTPIKRPQLGTEDTSKDD